MDALKAGPDPPTTGWRRSLALIAIVALAGATALAIAGIRAAGSDDVILSADDVVATAVPSTVAPIVTSRPATTAPRAPSIAEPAPTTSTDPPDRPTNTVEEVEPRAEPIGLQIDTIDVSRYAIRDVGLQENGQLEIPDETEIGWYKHGATAGHAGATVLAAHVNWKGSAGPFARLGAVAPGDRIEVELDDGSIRSYAVTERTTYHKLSLPKERIWRNTGPEELVLITCGGDFNPEIRSFTSNIVVYAVPIGSFTIHEVGTPRKSGLSSPVGFRREAHNEI